MSGTTGFGAPSFQTGDPAWNSALGTLAKGLFPDPTAAAHSYYYGSEARKAQIEGYKSIGEINAGNRAFGFLPGSGVPQSPITFQQPPIPGMGPIIAPAQNLPMQGAQGQPPPLSSAVAPPGGQGGQPPPLGPVSLDRLSSVIAPGDQPNDKGLGATGQPPPSSPPAPGTPPAPNTTTSNGQVPTNDQGSGPINMHAVTDADGGRKYSGPAASNGSPAVPQFDLGTYAALQAAAGRNPEMAKLQILSYILDAEQRGNLPVGTAKTIEQRQSQADQLSAAFGSPVFESKQATVRNAQTVAGGIAQQNIIQRQKESEFGRTPLSTQGVDAEGKPTIIMPGSAQTGQPAFNTNVYTTQQTPTTTGGGGPYGTAGVITRQQDMPKSAPAYNAEVDKAMNTSVRVYRTGPDGKPDVSQPTYAVKYGDALRDKLPITPESSDQVSAILRGAALTGDVKQPATRLADVVAGTQPVTPPSSAAQEGANALKFQSNLIEGIYQAPDTLSPSLGNRTEPAQLTAEASTALTDRRDTLMRANPRMTPENALQTARTQLENEGYLPTPGESAKARAKGLGWGNENINLQSKNGQVTGKFMIPLKKDYTSSLSNTVVRAAPTGAAPAQTQQPLGTPIGPAPPGAVEGQSFTKNGRIAVVHNGQLYEVNQ